jgi:hypothetical protein
MKTGAHPVRRLAENQGLQDDMKPKGESDA